MRDDFQFSAVDDDGVVGEEGFPWQFLVDEAFEPIPETDGVQQLHAAVFAGGAVGEVAHVAAVHVSAEGGQ